MGDHRKTFGTILLGLLTAATGLLAQIPVPPNAGSSALVLGVVVDAASGQPIGGATVTLIGRPAGRGGASGGVFAGGFAAGRDAGAADLSTAVQAAMSGLGGVQRLLTDAQGHFVLHDLPAGPLAFNVAAPGYLPGSVGQSTPGGPSHPIDLTDGERLTDLTIRLWKPGVLTGQVLDESGDPVVGAEVRALRRTGGALVRLTSAGHASTDDRGIFRIASLTPGSYLVAVPEVQITLPVSVVNSFIATVSGGPGRGVMDFMASGAPLPNPVGLQVGDYLFEGLGRGLPMPPAADGSLLEYQTTFYPATPLAGQAEPLAVRSGEERSGLTLQLRLVPTARIAGTVTGPDGPLAGVGVHLAPAGVDTGGDDGLDVATTATAADGTFLFLGVAPGQYLATVARQAPPPLPAGLAGNAVMQTMFGSGSTTATSGSPAPALYGQAPVTVGASPVEHLNLSLLPGATVAGQATFDGTTAPPTTAQLQRGRVTLTGITGDSSSASGLRALGGAAAGGLGADGSFKTVGYPPGRYFVSAPDLPGGWTAKSIVANGQDVLTRPLDLTTSDVTGMVVMYTDQLAQLSGTVHPGAGASSATFSATVLIVPADYRTWFENGMNRKQMRTVQASKTGAYALSSLLGGDYLVAALGDEEAAEAEDLTFFDNLAKVATHVTLGETDKHTLDLALVRLGR